MNPRIRELVKLTDGQFYEGFAGSTNFVKFAEDDLQKFAQLIVQECARVFWNIDDGELHSEYVRALKKHFEVE